MLITIGYTFAVDAFAAASLSSFGLVLPSPLSVGACGVVMVVAASVPVVVVSVVPVFVLASDSWWRCVGFVQRPAQPK